MTTLVAAMLPETACLLALWLRQLLCRNGTQGTCLFYRKIMCKSCVTLFPLLPLANTHAKSVEEFTRNSLPVP